VEIVSLATAESRTIAQAGREGNPRYDLSWSPDGRFLAYVDGQSITATTTIASVTREPRI